MAQRSAAPKGPRKPEWSCSCGCRDNWASRPECRSCGGRGPRQPGGGAKDSKPAAGGGELAKLRAENAQLKAAAAGAPGAGGGPPSTQPSAEDDDRLEEHQAALDKLGPHAPASVRAAWEQAVAAAREKRAEKRPLSENIKRATEKERRTRVAAEKAEQEVADAQAALDTAREKHAAAVAAAAAAQREREELTATRPTTPAQVLDQLQAVAPVLEAICKDTPQHFDGLRGIIELLRTAAAAAASQPPGAEDAEGTAAAAEEDVPMEDTEMVRAAAVKRVAEAFPDGSGAELSPEAREAKIAAEIAFVNAARPGKARRTK